MEIKINDLDQATISERWREFVDQLPQGERTLPSGRFDDGALSPWFYLPPTMGQRARRAALRRALPMTSRMIRYRRASYTLIARVDASDDWQSVEVSPGTFFRVPPRTNPDVIAYSIYGVTNSTASR